MQLSAILRRLTLITILTLLVWITLYFTVLEIRYVFFLWMILFLALAQVVDSALQQVEPGIRSILYMLVIGLFIVMCIRTVLISFTAYLPNRPLRPADCHDTSLCAIMEILNKPAAPGDRVFVLHAYRYYLRPDLFACSSRVEEYASLQPLARQNSADFWIELYRQGYRFIMYEKHLSERRYFFGSLPGLETAPKWMNIKVLYASPTKEQMIYEMEAIDPPFPPQVFCRQDSMGQWQLVSDSSLPLP